MKYQISISEKIYNSLRELSKNYNINLIDLIEFFKGGSKLLPKIDKGNKIHIKKKNEGKFTESAKAAGESVLQHAQSVLNNPNSTPLLRKRANFARNAKSWHH